MKKKQEDEAHQRFPWKPPFLDRCRAFLLSDTLRTGLQLAVGVFGVAMFPIVPRMRFSQDCLAATLYVVTSLLIAQSDNMGDKFMGAAAVIGPTWAGAVVAGIVVTIARAIQWRFTVWLCVFGVLGLIPFATVRAHNNPPVAKSVGIAGTLVYGVVVINSQFVPEIRMVWREVVVNLILCGIIAGLAAALSGAFILPSVAGNELRQSVGLALLGVGKSLSGYAGRIFAPDEHELAIQRAATRRSLHAALSQYSGIDPTDEEFFNDLEHATKPRVHRKPLQQGGPGGVPVGALRPLLGNARMKLHAVAAEPAALQRAPIVPKDWAALVGAVDELIMRVSALESLLEGRAQYLRSAFFTRFFGVDLLPDLRQVYALIAVACAKLGQAVLKHSSRSEVDLKVMFGDSWHILRKVLSHDIERAMDGYWSRIRREEQEGFLISPSAEMRALLFVAILTSGITDAMEAVEKAVATALDLTGANLWDISRGSAAPNGDKPMLDQGPEQKPLRHLHSTAQHNSQAADVQQEKRNAPHDMEALSLEVASAGQQSVSAPRQQKHPSLKDVWRVAWTNCAWVQALWRDLLCVGFAKQLWKVYVHDMPKALRSWMALKAVFRDRMFQFWLKFWGCCAAVLLLILILSAEYDAVRKYYPFFGFVSVPIVFNERVEMTVSRGVLRIVGTVIGGTIGFLIMLHHSLAADPYAHMALIVAFTFLFGLGGRTQYMYAIMLTIMSLNALVLCQVTKFTCFFCDEHGSPHYYVARVLSICLGCLAPVVVANLVLPWFASTTALELLAGAFESAASLCDQYVVHFYQQCAFEAGQGPKPDGAPSPALHSKVAGPLGMVQMWLAKESVLWKRGWYTFAPSVRLVLAEMQDMQTRLAALDIVVRQPPTITGTYSNANYDFFLKPALQDFQAVGSALKTMARSAAVALRGDGCCQYHQLRDDITALEASRNILRKRYLTQRENLHIAVKDAESSTDILTHDDSARMLSFTWAAVKTIDKAEAVAKTILLKADCRKRDSVWSWLK
ncbi:g9574 [Coccomyxa viridis]|uniref:G9574 protein n=1 Tax=Coccomyxa viridis TaxID=1274662 RepID=A0ABP1G3L3_9CHLO